MQSNLFFAKYNNLLCFFFLSFVSCCNFIIIAKDKENDKENTEVIRPNNRLFLTLLKILVPEKNCQNYSQYFIRIIKEVKYVLSLIAKDC